MAEPIQFLLIDGSEDQEWPDVLKDALAPLGSLRVVTEQHAIQETHDSSYKLTVVDAAAVQDVPQLVKRLAEEHPTMRIIVATASPTWTRAREALQSGAIDYMRKSIDPDDIRNTIRAALEKAWPSWTGA